MLTAYQEAELPCSLILAFYKMLEQVPESSVDDKKGAGKKLDKDSATLDSCYGVRDSVR